MTTQTVELLGGRYDGLCLEVPVLEGRPPGAPFWLVCWEHGAKKDPEVGRPSVTCPGSYSTHDSPKDFDQRTSQANNVAYYRCKDGRMRSPKFATWVEGCLS